MTNETKESQEKKPFTFRRVVEQEITVLARDWEEALEEALEGGGSIETRKTGPWERDEK